MVDSNGLHDDPILLEKSPSKTGNGPRPGHLLLIELCRHFKTLRQAIHLLFMPLLMGSFFLCFLVGAPTFPRYGFSVSQNAELHEIAIAAPKCGSMKNLIFLPPVVVDLNSDAGFQAEGLPETTAQMGKQFEFFIRLSLETSGLQPATPQQEKIMGDRITRLIEHLPLEAASVRGIMVEFKEPLADAALLNFTLASISTKGKVKKENLQIVTSLPAGFIASHGDLVKKMAIYTDFFCTTFTPEWQSETTWIAEHALNKPLFLRLETGPSTDSPQVAFTYVDVALAAAGTAVEAIIMEHPILSTHSRICTFENFKSQFIKSNYIVGESKQTPFSLKAGATGKAEYRVFVDDLSSDLCLMARLKTEAGNPEPLNLHGPTSGNFKIEWYDPLSGLSLTPGEMKRTGEGLTQSCECTSRYAFIFIHKLETPGEESVHSTVDVSAKADLTVEEIVARWQKYKEAQRQAMSNYIADCFMTLHFEPTNMGSGFDISMQLKQFWSQTRGAELLQTDFFINGVKFRKNSQFPLPQLEPKKVLSQPLELRLNEKYTYRSLGTDTVNGILCYVVGIEPKELNETLYSGKVWIDGTSFRQVKMDLTQRDSKSNIIANFESQVFELFHDGQNNEFNLIKSIYSQQTLNAAGRNFILEKKYEFSNYVINRASFDEALSDAHTSDNPMYRETDSGLRNLKKENGQRVLQEKSGKRIVSIISGAIYEGTFDFPIPLAGLSLVDFDFRGSGSQLSVFFAGPILATNLSKQLPHGFRFGMDLALSALPDKNKVYSGDTEIKPEGVWVYEQSSGFRASWQATNSLNLTGAFYVSFNNFRTMEETDKQFILPHNGLTLTPDVELEFASSGYILKAGASQSRRVGWKKFGYPDDPKEPFIEKFTKYYADFAKSFYFGRFTKTGIELSYFGGDKLDRFSRYRPSFFSKPRIKGIPSGTDSFDSIGIASISHGFNIMDFIRLEGSYSHAWGRNKAESNNYRNFDGLEFDLGTVGPWGTYLQGNVTYALTGNLNRYNSRWGVYFLIFKPLH